MNDTAKYFLLTVLVIIVGIAVIITADMLFTEYKPSKGIVKAHVQTSDKYGIPEFYIYILDDSSHHVYEKEVGHQTYYTLADNTPVWYTVSGHGISDLKTYRD